MTTTQEIPTKEKPLTAKQVARIITSRLLPTKAKPLNERSVIRLCKKGRIDGAYMVFGNWCIPLEGVEKFIEESKKNNGGRTYKRRAKKEETK